MIKRISIFAVVFLMAFLLWTPPASAISWGDLLGGVGDILGLDILGDVVGGATKGIFLFILSVIGIIVNALVWLAVGLVNFAIDINQTIVSERSFARFGWDITLNFANLLFVVAIVAIAFGTMFRRKWVEKMLTRLIIIALLINFSFFVATQLIVISNDITNVFLNAINSESQFDSLANFFTPNSLGEIDWSSLSSEAGSVVTWLTAPAFSIVFGFIAILTLLTVAVAFFVRYVALVILLILLPLALVLGLLPIKVGKMKNVWQEWQDSFFKWLIFGPAMTFFIYLAFALLEYPPATPTGGFIKVAGSSLGNYLALIGILLGGVIVANKMGVAGAGILQTGVNFAGGKFQLAAQGWGGKFEKRAEALGKEGKPGQARMAKFGADAFKGKYGMTSGVQKLKEGIYKTTGGKVRAEGEPNKMDDIEKTTKHLTHQIENKVRGQMEKKLSDETKDKATTS